MVGPNNSHFCTQNSGYCPLVRAGAGRFVSLLGVLQCDAVSVTVDGALPFSATCTDASPMYTYGDLSLRKEAEKHVYV